MAKLPPGRALGPPAMTKYPGAGPASERLIWALRDGPARDLYRQPLRPAWVTPSRSRAALYGKGCRCPRWPDRNGYMPWTICPRQIFFAPRHPARRARGDGVVLRGGFRRCFCIWSRRSTGRFPVIFIAPRWRCFPKPWPISAIWPRDPGPDRYSAHYPRTETPCSPATPTALMHPVGPRKPAPVCARLNLWRAHCKGLTGLDHRPQTVSGRTRASLATSRTRTGQRGAFGLNPLPGGGPRRLPPILDRQALTLCITLWRGATVQSDCQPWHQPLCDYGAKPRARDVGAGRTDRMRTSLCLGLARSKPERTVR